MSNLEDLLFLSGNDIPFAKAQITIHQPRLKEIAYIGEEAFFSGCEFLNFSKDNLSEEDRIHLENMTNFEILMSIIEDNNNSAQFHKVYIYMLLSLIFPNYAINIKDKKIILTEEETDSLHIIDNNNFEDFKKIINQMFNLKKDENTQDYNPEGELAKKIAEKFRKRKKKLSQNNQLQENTKVDIISRYVSILTVGEKKDINSFMNYTIYQLFDEFKRYELKMHFDMYIQAKMAGAKDLDEVEDWMKDIHS